MQKELNICSVHFFIMTGFCEIYPEDWSFCLFVFYVSLFHLKSLLLMSPVRPFHFSSVYLSSCCPSQWSLPPLEHLSVCLSVCLSVYLWALLCKALAEWWKCVLFILVREGENEGGMYCIDTIVKMTCESQMYNKKS